MAILYKVKVKFEINSNIGIMTIPDLINGDLRLLRKYIPVNQKYFKLILVFIFDCFFTDTHYVILLLIGPSGSAKSFITTVIKALVDPSPVTLRNQITTAKDLAIAAYSSHLIDINNSSRISNSLQDNFCTMVTGGVSAGRTLFSNKGQSAIHTHNPVVINGIGDVFTRDDALQRSVTIPLKMFSETDIVPVSESELTEDFMHDLPVILGGVFNALSKILAEYPNVKKPEKMNRMMDFHFLGCVTEKALGWKPGSFTVAYDENILTSQVVVLEGSAVAQALIKMKRFNNDFIDTYSELIQRFNAKGEVIKIVPRELSAEFDRISASLFKVHGIKATKLKRSNSGSRVKITFN